MSVAVAASRPAHVPDDRVIDFDVNAPLGPGGDFHQAWHKLVADTPHKLMWTDRNGGHWIVTDGPLLHQLFDRPEVLSNRILFIPRDVSQHHKLVPTTLDPPEHTPYRTLLNRALSPRTVRMIHDNIAAVSAELIDGFVARGTCDFIADYSSQFPIRIFMALVGLPQTDAAMLKYCCDAMVRANPDLPFTHASDMLAAYLAPVVRQRRQSPGDDLLSVLLVGEIDGATMTDTRALQLAMQVLIAGLDTVVNMLGFVWYYLATHPEAQAALADVSKRADMVEEIIRRFPGVTIARLALSDIEVDDVVIRADDVVAMPTMVHGLDPSVHSCPMELDFTRRAPAHSTFGNGPHRCPGAHLARTEILISLDQWFARIPRFAYDGDAPPVVHGGIVGTLESLPLRWDA
ncbi:MAG: cytochrome P450 [Sphingobium sp.]|uniref:cytochrome P450 n=1 Tax=Sphingobium sp. CECT 9361 TaxID=2845384 RepID=UPI001E44B159|nr:cytochrome P450 [Sphingobium sp. CECT 9361]CAH0353208.1 Camphor 5-monooxygenase [Sphingobium sp. CECT 9361]